MYMEPFGWASCVLLHGTYNESHLTIANCVLIHRKCAITVYSISQTVSPFIVAFRFYTVRINKR